jgi:hypothetical protein
MFSVRSLTSEYFALAGEEPARVDRRARSAPRGSSRRASPERVGSVYFALYFQARRRRCRGGRIWRTDLQIHLQMQIGPSSAISPNVSTAGSAPLFLRSAPERGKTRGICILNCIFRLAGALRRAILVPPA